MGSSPDPGRQTPAKFKQFVRQILAVPKSELDARLDDEKRKKRDRLKRPPTI